MISEKRYRVGILGGVRIPFCRAGTAYAKLTPLELLTAALQGIVGRWQLHGETLGDVTCGAVLNRTADWNLTRSAVWRSGLSKDTPAYDIQRACGTSLETAIAIANKIACGQIEVGIAGGVDSMSAFPDLPGIIEPSTGKHMGQHCEITTQAWNIPREAQDRWALGSHQKALTAYDRGFYKNLLIPFQGVSQDNGVRRDTSLEKLKTLQPVFDKSRGTLTAGNSTAFTDGAACVLLCSEAWAKSRGLKIPIYFHDAQVTAVDFTQEGLLMAPAYAVPKLLARSQLTLQDIDLYELHEAFAAQVLATLKAWSSEKFCKEKLGLAKALGEIDPEKINQAGGSVALGHPFGATGARMLATLVQLFQENPSQTWGLLSACTGGGMGVSVLVKRAGV